jgi:formylglycine-generating enzyme required for sulfatase activity
VSYSYSIDKYDVTNNQYVEFLNTKDPTGANALGLWNSNMGGPGSQFGGISLNPGNANGSKYTVDQGDGNHPVFNATWYSAARFGNWLNNGQGNGTTESGAYNLPPGSPANGGAIGRSAGATIFLPSENEWYKAAYYNPATSSYFTYGTGSSLAPSPVAPTSSPNAANYAGVLGTLTDVGAYSGSASPYGLFDMTGNAFQWTDTIYFDNPNARYVRGGGATNTLLDSSSGSRIPSNAASVGYAFRVASIPEPSSVVLATFGVAGFAAWGWRRRKR